MKRHAPVLLTFVAGGLLMGLVTGCQRGTPSKLSNQASQTPNVSQSNTLNTATSNVETLSDKAKASRVAEDFLVTASSATYKDISSFTAADRYASPAFASIINEERKKTEQEWVQKKYYEKPGQPSSKFVQMDGEEWEFLVSVPVVAYEDPGGQVVDSTTLMDDIRVAKTPDGVFEVVDAVDISAPSS